MEWFFGTLAFVTTLVGLIPQVAKAYQTKSTTDLSMLMILNCLICSLAWIVYGWVVDSAFVLYSNVVGVVTSGILSVQKWVYDARKQP